MPAGRLVEALAAQLGASCIETHISWVLLAGADAYKIKKPVRLAFVDYGTLEARRRCCEEELRLNRRLAPSLYLGVLPITGDEARPQLDGGGPAIEYAVHMRRFPPGALFSEMLAAGTLAPSHVDAFADHLAAFHARAANKAPDASHGSPARRRDCALAALEGARAHAGADGYADLHEWLRREAARLQPLWAARQASGCIRECHGDLHLANIVVVDGDVMAFDGIEFDPALRWIDILDDVAFTVMDFGAHGRADLAFRLLNGWLDRSGEHAGVPALGFACAYRALVRAQVATLRADAALARRYVDAARGWTRPRPARLTITHGLPGSGKTFRSQALLEREGAIRLRSDVERKRLFGLAMLERSRERGLDIYTPAAGGRTYAVLLEKARALLEAGWPVVLDAAFLRRAERDQARALAREVGVPFAILDCEAPQDVMRERLRARSADASEADAAVLAQLAATAQPLGEDERASVM